MNAPTDIQYETLKQKNMHQEQTLTFTIHRIRSVSKIECCRIWKYPTDDESTRPKSRDKESEGKLHSKTVLSYWNTSRGVPRSLSLSLGRGR